MKAACLILVLFILVGCGNEQTENNSATNLQSDTSAVKSLELENERSLNTTTKSKNDTSWNVVLAINEGFFESYTINYSNGKQLTVPVDERIILIGGVDHPPARFINDTTYFVPHIGGSKNGHFELYIYKNGKCKYKEVITRKPSPTIIDEEVEISQAPQPTAKQPEIKTNYIQTATHLKLTKTIKNFGSPSIGCSESQTEINFSVPINATDTCYIANNDLKNIAFNYHYSGGLYEETSKQLLKGYIKGSKQPDNSWLIESEIWFEVTSFPNKKNFEKKLQFNEIYR
jgi:hypothetical protein